MRRAGQLQSAANHRALERSDHRHAAILNAVEHPMPHLRMPQTVGRIVFGQLRQIETGREMIADAMDDDGADIVREFGKAILYRQHNAVVQRIALGRAVQTHGQDRARLLNLEQRCAFGLRGRGGVSHGSYYFLSRIVIFYNDLGRSQYDLSTVVARLDRAIQYSRDVSTEKPRRTGSPACAGD